MTAGTSPTAARKRAREHAGKLLDAEDAERRRLEAARRKRITEQAAEIAGNDAEIEQLTAKIEDLRADSARRLAAIVADGVTEAQTAEMTGRELREVKAAVKATAASGQAAPPKKKSASPRAARPEPAAA
ncbi:hypothetical protein [Catenulispora pinisilvae]|uniref:hypothetical protein n=1 Tax=Catenulispora pinisilvae TaxID=2705253 RepID=UPI001891A84D|nr:hypothetical protein [Catenulispora pinisilvae]